MTFIDRALQDITFFPFWLDNPDAPTVEPELIGQTEADLLIIGGGFTGLWAAIQAKEQNPDRDVILIESGKIAYGASGRPGAIVSTSIMHGLSNAARIFPNDLQDLERLGLENMTGFKRSLDLYNIDADDEWGGELTVAVGKHHVTDLDEEFRLHQTHGHDVVLLDRDQVQAEINSPLYEAGVWSKNLSGTVHPAKLAWGLKKAAKSLGVRIHEMSPMESMQQTGPGMTVRTHSGQVKCEKVLLATNAFCAGHKHIKKRVACVRDRLLMTEPLSDNQLGRIGWKNRQGVYDNRTQMNYSRLTKDNRILFGGRLAYAYNGETDPKMDRTVEPYKRLATAFSQAFPQLDDISFTHAWSGPIALTTRMAVHFQHYYDDKVVWAGGYSGFGVSASRFGARVGLGLLKDPKSKEWQYEFAQTMPNKIPPEPFRWLGAAVTLYASDTADEKGGWRPYWLRLIDKIGFPMS
jgi:glycine/D-amino acid oxidase-like deaminating enzyme